MLGFDLTRGLGPRLRQTRAYPPIRIITDDLGTITAGEAFSLQLEARFASPGALWSVTAGSDGELSLSSGGLLTGTVTVTTPLSFTVTVVDPNGTSDFRAYSATPVEGGGGEPYVASAVHFDTASFLEVASLTASDSPYLTFAVFFRCTEAWIGAGPANYLSMLDFYPAGDEDIVGFNNTGSGHGFFTASFDDNPDNGQSFVYQSVPPASLVYDGEWHSLVASLDFGHEGNAKLGAAYLDRTLIPVGGNFMHPDKPGFAFKFSAAPVAVPDSTEDVAVLPECDLAVYQLFVGTNIVQGDNTILAADLNNFVTADNKPVDPAVAELAYGAPTILFDGDATGFATNQGTGGVFTLTGSLTNAATSPSA